MLALTNTSISTFYINSEKAYPGILTDMLDFNNESPSPASFL